LNLEEVESKKFEKEFAMSDDRPGCLAYIVGGLSFIPLIGVFFGAIVILWGLIKIRNGGWKLILLGGLGICCTVFVYGTLFYKGFVEKGGTFDNLRSEMAQTLLTDLIKNIEYYKLQKGEYPAKLEELEPEDKQDRKSLIMIDDPTYITSGVKGRHLFYYELTNKGKNYYLFSSGRDGEPFTDDDIHPVVAEDEKEKIGYVKE